MTKKIIWTERLIGRQLARQIFNNKCLVVVPNCNWTGDELDILAVTQDLRVIDVEIKISRSDLKADNRKDKWYHNFDWRKDTYGSWKRKDHPREWPRRVWKHYYAMPESIWTPELEAIIQPVSGILLLRDQFENIKVERRARPCRDAQKISAEDALNLARLASLRMWEAYDELRNRNY